MSGLIPYGDPETQFMFHFLIPKSLTSFVCYGLLPLLFYKLGMTGQEDALVEDRPAENLEEAKKLP